MPPRPLLPHDERSEEARGRERGGKGAKDTVTHTSPNDGTPRPSSLTRSFTDLLPSDDSRGEHGDLAWSDENGHEVLGHGEQQG